MPFGKDNNTGTTNLLIAIVLFMIFMFVQDYFAGLNNKEQIEQAPQQAVEEQQRHEAAPTNMTVDESLAKPSRIYMENANLIGSIDLENGAIDSIALKQYKTSAENLNENVHLLTPINTENAFYYEISYSGVKNSVWKVDEKSSKQSIIIKTTNQDLGLVIERKISFDDKYILNVTDRLINTSDNVVEVSSFADIIRQNPKVNNYAVVHEGFVGFDRVENKVQEVKYSDVGTLPTNVGAGKWFGYTDIYWLVSHINNCNGTITYSKIENDTYKCSLSPSGNVKIDAKSAVDVHYSLFAGPKDIRLLKGYSKTLNIDKFEMAIDFGWFFMFTKPILTLLDFMSSIFSNMGIVILLLTLMFKIITYPLTKKSFRSAARMKEIQPKISALQKSYANDKQKMNAELMQLYKKERISPLSGCLPMLLQAPIFFCLYKVFFISLAMRHAPLFWWVKDLSAPDSMYIFNICGLIDWTPPKILQIGVWPIIMGISMFIQQKLSSTSVPKASSQKTQEAKIQENMMYALPVLFTYICSSFPVGVVLYWTISNILSILQQRYINSQVGSKKIAKHKNEKY